MQGASLQPFITGSKPTTWRNDFLYEFHELPNQIISSEAVRSHQWKYIRYFRAEPVIEELYHLQLRPT